MCRVEKVERHYDRSSCLVDPSAGLNRAGATSQPGHETQKPGIIRDYSNTRSGERWNAEMWAQRDMFLEKWSV